jgi:hypothetical protein
MGDILIAAAPYYIEEIEKKLHHNAVCCKILTKNTHLQVFLTKGVHIG